ncbi:hypothetical protein [Ructibacterium gallinarum]|uniref:Uncharacterized protein n=1 Tax=Ructibacterium gallinarum TaxID=2779355 RepID=A0A9D5M2P9_9FIRM|nr:hypothetical protein [Ructibacterium gallinarum]MBE5039584.1 hypothetical protein [Ructibacterium gallinarum]
MNVNGFFVPDKEIMRALCDVGCDDTIIDKFIKTDGRKKDMLHILQEQRVNILNILHPVQRQLECIDFLIYKIRKAGEK